MRADQTSIGRQEGRFDGLGERDVHGIRTADARAQFPCTLEERSVVDALTRPIPQIIDRLGCGRSVQTTEFQVLADDAENLDIDQVGGELFLVRGKSVADGRGCWRCCDDLEQAACVNDQHRATVHAPRRGRR